MVIAFLGWWLAASAALWLVSEFWLWRDRARARHDVIPRATARR